MSLPVVAIIGRPNVGKSTLFNRLIGRREAIVENVPGVTRDRRYAYCEFQRQCFYLVDTGGLDPSVRQGLMAHIKAHALRAIKEADAVIVLFDGREGLTSTDQEIVDLLRRQTKPIFYAVNKLDGPPAEARMFPEFYRLGCTPLYPVSAEQSYKVYDLIEDVAKSLPPSPLPLPQEEKEQAEGIPRVAVVGRPNVGKSTLINTLLGEERLIVSEEPGTTRDPIDTLVTSRQGSYLFIDTAGIRRRGRIQRGVEQYSMLRALRAIERADVALLLIDGEEGITGQDTKIAGHILARHRACVLLVNKWDLFAHDREAQAQILGELKWRFDFLPDSPVLLISALTKLRLRQLFTAINEVFSAYTRRVGSGELNRACAVFLQSAPTQAAGRAAKVYYLTQVGIRPPTFVLFVNHPERITDPYRRFVENRLRETFGFVGCPLVLHIRRHKRG